jgi:hypothetical protein
MASKIMKCTCENEFQDKEHGKGNRVFNSCGKDKATAGWRCTACARKVLDPLAPLARSKGK